MFQSFYRNRRSARILASLLAAALIVSGAPSSVVKASSVSSGDGQAAAAVQDAVSEAESGGVTPQAAEADVPAAQADTHTMWIVGDSTVCSFNDNYYYPRYGYGTQIGNYLDDTYTVQNLALSGRSSKSFFGENNYTTLKNGIQEGDVLVIGFGHNDEKPEADRYTNPNGNYQTEGSFAKSLYDNYVRIAQDKGAEVILCTPIVRRNKNAAALTDSQCHITTDATDKEGNSYPGGDYAKAIKDLGTAVNVPVVDLTALTKSLYESLGPSETLYLHAWTSDKEGSADDTHLNIYGAKKVAWLFANAAKDTNTNLAAHISLDAGEPSKANDLEENKDYVPPTYDSNLPDSTIFQDYVIGEGDSAVHFKGTAFGNLGGNPSASNHVLGTDTDGNMHIAVLNNKGKINASSDGIVMYYYKVPTSSQFKFSAKATVNAIVSNQEVAFGLMARDDMYIDLNNTSLVSDYVVAGTLGTGCNCFYRKSGALGGKAALTTETLAAGKSYNLSIESNSDGYACTFGKEPTQTGGYDFQLTSVDSEYVYIGMFAARNADITYSNIYLEVDGNVIVDTRKTEYNVTVTSDENGTASANSSTAAAGQTVTLTAEPKEGYLFKEWQVVSGGVTIADNKFTMPAGNVEVKAVFEEIRTEWDFQKDETLYGTNGVKYEGTSGTVAGLQIDASAGKWDSTGTGGWVQTNAGTIIKVPVQGTSKVTVVGYYQGSYSVDGQESTAAAQTADTFTCEGTDGFAVIELTANSYIRSIKVTPLAYVAAGTTDFTPTSATESIKGISFVNIKDVDNEHGFQTKADGASMVLSLSDKANITVLTCRYGAGTAGTMSASSGTVSQKEVNENGANGLQFTVLGAAAGEVTLTFANNMYIHNVMVEYTKEVGPRNIDVWDFGGKVETDTKTYTNNITPDALNKAKIVDSGGLFLSTSPTAFGDLTMTYNAGDRLYTNVAGLPNNGSYGPAQAAYDDGFTAAGGWYCNGTGGSGRRYVTIANVQAGDKIVAYVCITQTSDSQFFFEGTGAASEQKDSVDVAITTYKKLEFVAEHTGTYKIWENNLGKPMYHRIMRVPGVAVSGTIDFGEYKGTDYSLKFVNQTTKKETVATVESDGTFTVKLAPGYTYTAVFSGATGYGFTTASKTVVTTDAESLTGKEGVKLVVEPKSTYTYSGKIVGFADGYDVSKLAMTMIPSADSNLDAVDVTINADMSFTTTLEPDVPYTIDMTGVNDYEVKAPSVVENSENATADITVALKPMHKVSGGFIGLSGSAKVTALTFTNEEDKYVYTAAVTDTGYEISLRDGAYLAKATVSGYTTQTHVVVSGGAVSKDLMFVSTTAKDSLPWVSDIYVGYPDKANNYETVSEAVEACELMNPTSEKQRITVHIAPGTYREQVMVKAPYVSFVNDSDKEVLLTWYYGIGYKYYSSDASGYYNPQNAYDKYDKHIANRWGVAVYVKDTATAFRAEGITFENSFNRYITDEELADGVECTGETVKIERKYNTDVNSKAATERAAAIVVEADQAEFRNCSFYSSQDTVYTQGSHLYFKNCLLEGQTDYIFGSGSCVFDACELSFKGYSTGSQGGYITANRPNAGESGYLFRNCTVTGNDKLTVTAGYWGRPWGKDAKVTFMNTKLESATLIEPAGWTEMSGADPKNANFFEYNTTTADGAAADTSKRVRGVMTKADADKIQVTDYFGSWVPAFYQAEEAVVAFTEQPRVTDNGDINAPYPGHTLTVRYSLGEANDNNDASVIRWYIVDENGGNETLVKTSTASVDKTYQIEKAAIGKYIKVTVTPETVSGATGEAASYQVEAFVRDGYENPSGGSDITLGEGINIFLAGDSTVKDYSANGMYNSGKALNEGAWGEFLQNFFNEDNVKIQNYAQGGRSCRTFINEGKLQAISENMGEGDYLLIQFGHNDCADTYPDRYVPLGDPDANGIYPSIIGTPDANGEYPNGGNGTFKWFLKQYIDAAKAKGAIPVLVTPVARMYYNADGTIKTHHDSAYSSNNAYVTAVKQLAEEENVLLIDAYDLTKTLFEDAYKEAGADTYGKQIMASGDKTHNNKLGGLIEAAAIATAIQDMGLNISKTVQAPAKVLGETTDGKTVFTVNAEGTLTAYDINSDYADRAPYWEAIGQAMIDAIRNKTVVAPTTYTITIVNGMASSTKAAEGETITITAGAVDGKTFKNWVVKSENVVLTDDTSAETTFRMPAGAVEIEAVFEEAAPAPDDHLTVTVESEKTESGFGVPDGMGIQFTDTEGETVQFVDEASGKPVAEDSTIIIDIAPQKDGAPTEAIKNLAEQLVQDFAASAGEIKSEILYFDISAYANSVAAGNKVNIKEGSGKVRIPFLYPNGFNRDSKVIILHGEAVVPDTDIEKWDTCFWLATDGFSPYTFVFLSDVQASDSDDDDDDSDDDDNDAAEAGSDIRDASGRPVKNKATSPKTYDDQGYAVALPSTPSKNVKKDNGGSNPQQAGTNPPSESNVNIEEGIFPQLGTNAATVATTPQPSGNLIYWLVIVAVVAAAVIVVTKVNAFRKKQGDYEE
ncbi:MAG: pectinesterase family protein [Bacteroidales bacterium]|nr:pectinesterase family protein [Lachnoclostridium sp.]MCM1384879.1 pectinesterase family protein [Lachnoclostridium sp.]MCM1465589.1 pectinesterase family protein [Bacteroidales bacterium]